MVLGALARHPRAFPIDYRGYNNQVERNLSIAVWSVDAVSGHCVHPSGLVAYINPDVTSSGAIRCIGPFDLKRALSGIELAACLGELTRLVEQIPNYEQAYVVWGAYLPIPSSAETSLTILGEECGWVPNLSLRTEFGLSSSSDSKLAYFNREWELTDEGLVHRAGLRIAPSTSVGGSKKGRVVVSVDVDRQVIPVESKEFVIRRFTELSGEVFEGYVKAYCEDYRPVRKLS